MMLAEFKTLGLILTKILVSKQQREPAIIKSIPFSLNETALSTEMTLWCLLWTVLYKQEVINTSFKTNTQTVS